MMGQMMVSEFREELHALFGTRGVGDDRMLRWINFAVREIAGAEEFEELKFVYTFTSVVGEPSYKIACDFLRIVYIVDRTNKYRLRRIDPQDIGLEEMFDSASFSQPQRWSNRMERILLFPVPDGNYEIETLYLRSPAPLVDNTDVTPFPVAWDLNVLMLAKQYGHLAFGEIDQANAALQRAIGGMKSTRLDEDWLSRTPHPGLQVAWQLSDLTGYGPQQ